MTILLLLLEPQARKRFSFLYYFPDCQCCLLHFKRYYFSCWLFYGTWICFNSAEKIHFYGSQEALENYYWISSSRWAPLHWSLNYFSHAKVSYLPNHTGHRYQPDPQYIQTYLLLFIFLNTIGLQMIVSSTIVALFIIFILNSFTYYPRLTSSFELHILTFLFDCLSFRSLKIFDRTALSGLDWLLTFI